LYRFGAMCFNDDCACNNNCCSRQDMILCIMNAKRWFYYPCYRDLRLFPSLFWFFFDFLCTCQYNLPSTNCIGTFDAHILS
jgi:hypothetical protein